MDIPALPFALLLVTIVAYHLYRTDYDDIPRWPSFAWKMRHLSACNRLEAILLLLAHVLLLAAELLEGYWILQMWWNFFGELFTFSTRIRTADEGILAFFEFLFGLVSGCAVFGIGTLLLLLPLARTIVELAIWKPTNDEEVEKGTAEEDASAQQGLTEEA